MDEVEPALDDVNLHRFLRLIEGFARDSQVLIVTHQKRTMEIAAMMYGISLNKDGTTKVVCQRLESKRSIEDDARLEGSLALQEPAQAPAEDPAGVALSEPVG
jgi:DNA repair ATPase RecN